MPRGGYRAGAGSKKGIPKAKITEDESISRTVRRKAVILLAEKTAQKVVDATVGGITPLEVMLKTMRVLWDKAQPPETVDGGTGEIDLEMAKAAIVVADKAAPYIHPRVAPREAPPEKPPEKPQIDVQESARRIAFALALGSQKAIEHKAA